MRLVRALLSTSLLVLAAACAFDASAPTSPTQATVIAASVPARIAIQVLTLEQYADVRADVFAADNRTVAGVPVTFTTTAGTLTSATAMTDTVGVAYTRVMGGTNATVTISAGAISTTGTITRSAGTFAVSLSIGPRSPRTDGTASLSASASPLTLPATYTWTFGDGATETSTTDTVGHRYLHAGTLLAGVTVLDAAGRSGSASATVHVVDPPAPTPPPDPPPTPLPSYTVTLSASPSSVAVGGTATLTATVTANNGAVPPTSYTWDCDNNGTQDATTATNTTPCVYPTAGLALSRVTVTDGTVTGSGVTTVTVTAPPFAMSGSGNTVFDMPTTVIRVHITGTYAGTSSNFIVHIGGQFIVNEIIGSTQTPTTHDAIYRTIGGVVEVINSTGVAWTFTEVR